MSSFVFRRHLKRSQIDAMKTAAQQGHMVLSILSVFVMLVVLAVTTTSSLDAWTLRNNDPLTASAFLAHFLLLHISALAFPNLSSILGPCGITFLHVAIYGWMIFLYFLTPWVPWGSPDGQTNPYANASGFNAMLYSTVVRLLSAVFFETSGF